MDTAKNATLLLVEDEALIAMMEKAQLERDGYSVIHARSGEEAVQIAQGTNIDLILMDIDLGAGIDGGEAARRILQARPIPLAFLSSHSDQETIDKTEEITSYGYILKGAGPIVLSATIKMALRLARSNTRISQLEQRFSRAFQHSAAGMSISNIANEPTIIECNSAFSRITGYSRDEVLGRPSAKLELFADTDVRRRIIEMLKTESQVQSMSVTLQRKDKAKVQVLLSVVLVQIDGLPHTITSFVPSET